MTMNQDDEEECPACRAGECDERVVCTMCGYDGHAFHACEAPGSMYNPIPDDDV